MNRYRVQIGVRHKCGHLAIYAMLVDADRFPAVEAEMAREQCSLCRLSGSRRQSDGPRRGGRRNPRARSNP